MYKRQGQYWIYTLAYNAGTTGLDVKTETVSETLEGHQHMGMVYVWLMFNVIVNITNNVAAGLKSRINIFGQKNCSGLYL